MEKDQEICEIDSDKATLTVSAEDSGEIKLLKDIEMTIPVGEVICTINTSVKSAAIKTSEASKESKFDASEVAKIPSPAAQKIIGKKYKHFQYSVQVKMVELLSRILYKLSQLWDRQMAIGNQKGNVYRLCEEN